jgi:hypothetical protein
MGYNSDHLMRAIPRWLTYLQAAQDMIYRKHENPIDKVYDESINKKSSRKMDSECYVKIGPEMSQLTMKFVSKMSLDTSEYDLLSDDDDENENTATHEITATKKVIRSNSDSSPKSHLKDGSFSVKLNNGIDVPVLGLGTWQINGKECEVSPTPTLNSNLNPPSNPNLNTNLTPYTNSVPNSNPNRKLCMKRLE